MGLIEDIGTWNEVQLGLALNGLRSFGLFQDGHSEIDLERTRACISFYAAGWTPGLSNRDTPNRPDFSTQAVKESLSMSVDQLELLLKQALDNVKARVVMSKSVIVSWNPDNPWEVTEAEKR